MSRGKKSTIGCAVLTRLTAINRVGVWAWLAAALFWGGAFLIVPETRGITGALFLVHIVIVVVRAVYAAHAAAARAVDVVGAGDAQSTH